VSRENKIGRAGAGGIGCSTVLLLIFVVLKLAGLVDWAWVWVLSPLWLTALPVLLILAVLVADGDHCITALVQLSESHRMALVPTRIAPAKALHFGVAGATIPGAALGTPIVWLPDDKLINRLDLLTPITIVNMWAARRTEHRALFQILRTACKAPALSIPAARALQDAFLFNIPIPPANGLAVWIGMVSGHLFTSKRIPERDDPEQSQRTQHDQIQCLAPLYRPRCHQSRPMRIRLIPTTNAIRQTITRAIAQPPIRQLHHLRPQPVQPAN
jgi:hypothetical protein